MQDDEFIFALVLAVLFILVPMIAILINDSSQNKDNGSKEEFECSNAKSNSLLSVCNDKSIYEESEKPKIQADLIPNESLIDKQIITESLQLASVQFDNYYKEYWYKIREGVNVNVKDRVLVETGATGTKLATVTAIRTFDTSTLSIPTPYDGIRHYKYIIKKWDNLVATKKYHLFKVEAQVPLYNKKISIWVLDESNSFKYGDCICFEYHGVNNSITLNELENSEMFCNEVDAPYPIYKITKIKADDNSALSSTGNNCIPSSKEKYNFTEMSEIKKIGAKKSDKSIASKHSYIVIADDYLYDFEYDDFEYDDREIRRERLENFEFAEMALMADDYFEDDFDESCQCKYFDCNSDYYCNPWNDVDERLSK